MLMPQGIEILLICTFLVLFILFYFISMSRILMANIMVGEWLLMRSLSGDVYIEVTGGSGPTVNYWYNHYAVCCIKCCTGIAPGRG